MKKNRILGLDLVRCIAIIFVFCYHFIYKTGFYNIKMAGIGAFIILFIRCLFYICVPLFLLLTGYLQSKKNISKNYYHSIFKVLTSYFFIEIIIMFFKRFYLHDTLSFKQAIYNIIGFNVADYSWYVEMYIGLFLLIPFLNIIYRNLKNKQQKLWLIITLLILTGVPSALSYLPEKVNLFPNWWQNIYPLTYYFIGCYLREYQFNIRKRNLLIYILINLLLKTAIKFIVFHNQDFDWNCFEGYGSIPIVLLTVFVFLLFYKCDFKNKILRKVTTETSLLSFDMYLFSYILDNILYQYFKFNSPIHAFTYFPLILLIIYLSTFILAFIKKYLFIIIKKIFSHFNFVNNKLNNLKLIKKCNKIIDKIMN